MVVEQYCVEVGMILTRLWWGGSTRARALYTLAQERLRPYKYLTLIGPSRGQDEPMALLTEVSTI